MSACTAVPEGAADSPSDTELAVRAQAGDLDALVLLHDRYREKCLRGFRHWLWEKDWAEECADEAWARIYEKLPQYNRARGSFGTWAFDVAYSSLHNHVRYLHLGRKDVPLSDMMAEFLPAPTGPEVDFIRDLVWEKVHKLPYEQDFVLESRFGYLCKDKETAERLRILRRKVCYRCDQGLRSLHDQLISDIRFMSIRPEMRFPVYKQIVNRDGNARRDAQPGGKEGDCS
jgi:DNA-directed RNA polymerase specialized sigma24 family protein